MIASLVVLIPALGAAPTVLAALAWGGVFTATPVILQAAILRVAPDARDAASAVYVVAFQVGIGGGALLGERFVRAGLLAWLPALAALLALAAVLVVLASRRTFPAHLPAPEEVPASA
nr:hypothetical protein GCM10020092_006940 [Actinoplanes digitatis]